MKITTINSVTATKETVVELAGFEPLIDWLQSNSKQIKDKKDGALWSPCTFVEGRFEEKAHEICALVLDFDGDKPDLTLINKLNLAYFWHQTFSGEKSRLILELDKPVAARDWPKFWANATHLLNFTTHDQACKNASRFYFFPVGKHYHYQRGRALPVDEILTAQGQANTTEDVFRLRQVLLKAPKQERAAQIRAALAGKPIAEEGNRDNSVTALGWYLARFIVPDGFSYEAVHSLLHRGLSLPGKEPKTYWEAKFKASYEKGAEERKAKQTLTIGKLQLDKEWAAQLQLRDSVNGPVIIPNTHNASVILESEGSFAFRENLLDGSIEFARGGDFNVFDDVAATDLSNWLQQSFRISLSRSQVYEQVEALARRNSYDPIKDYLLSLKWDGNVRVENFLTTYMGAKERDIYYAYSKRFLLSLVARALRPGCKVDSVLTLVGPQGFGKSSVLRAISEPYFSDTRLNLGDKDSYAIAGSAWVHEVAELASLKRSDLENTKAFFSAQEDYYRPPFRRAHIRRPRRCVFVATTNESVFLKDTTGNRRWWVVNVEDKIDVERLRKDRDQILAEAVHLFNLGEQWYLTKDEEAQHDAHVGDYELEDVEVDTPEVVALKAWFEARPVSERPICITVGDVYMKAMGVEPHMIDQRLLIKMGRYLTKAGFERMRMTSDGGGRKWAYKFPVSWFKLKAVEDGK